MILVECDNKFRLSLASSTTAKIIQSTVFGLSSSFLETRLNRGNIWNIALLIYKAKWILSNLCF
mgnify:CR=1 FL=1